MVGVGGILKIEWFCQLVKAKYANMVSNLDCRSNIFGMDYVFAKSAWYP